MPTSATRIDSEVLRRLEAQKPSYMSTTAFLSQVVDSHLDASCRLGSQAQPGDPSYISSSSFSKAVTSNAGALSEKPSKKLKDPFSSKRISAESVPPELRQHADLIVDFWAIKKGTRSERAWNGLMNKLNGMTPEDQGKALENAYNGGWASVFEPKADTHTQARNSRPVGIVPAAPLSPAMQEWMNS